MSSLLSIERIVDVALQVALVMAAAIVHEVAHGWVAHLCGDDTAKEAGRLTLDPRAHLDPFGSLLLPLLMALAGGGIFAYAKPVPYNPARLKNRRRDEALVALAGPASNLAQALVAALALRALYALGSENPSLWYAGPELLGYTPLTFVLYLLSLFIWVNLMLCFFNLIPVPPLDGSKLLLPFLTGKTLETYERIQAYAMPVLIIFLFVLPRLGLDPVSGYLELTAGRAYGFLWDLALGGL